MNITTLKERIEKANAKIEKKENTIVKKTASIEKKSAYLMKKYGWDIADRTSFISYIKEKGYDDEQASDISWTISQIEWLEEDIQRGGREIEETKKTIAKYESQLAGEIERESILLREVPECMRRMQEELAEKWDRWDIDYRNTLRKAYKEMSYREFIEKYRYAGYEAMQATDENIHKSNMRDAKGFIIQLYYRVKNVTGEVTNWAGIRLETGAWGYPTLNGIVIGKEGKAEVESILAGGYNIQRLHIRTIVHDIS